MSRVHRLRITSGPSGSAASMADLSTDDVWVMGDSLDLGDPDVSFDASGFPLESARSIGMSVHISGVGAAAGIVMQQIARAISVPGRWLMIQREPASDPVWFRLRPASPGSLDMDSAWVDRQDGYWTWSLSLLTDSTAVGERRAVPRVGSDEVVTTIPNEGMSRGLVIDAPGEAPCPLSVEVLPSVTYNGKRPLVSTYSVPLDSPLVAGGSPTIIMDDDAFERYTAHSTRASGAAFLSGGSGIGMTMDTTAYRVWAEGPQGGTTSGQDLEPGRYLVLARLYRDGAAGEIDVRMSERWGDGEAWQQWRTWRPTAGGDRASWVPLGYLQHPYGDDGVGFTPEELIAPLIRIAARVTSTSAATMYIDQVAYLPVDLARGACETSTFAQFQDGIGAGPTHSWDFDAEHRRVAVVDFLGKVHSSPAPLRTGGWPVAVPGMATGVSVFLDTSDTPSGVDDVSATIDVTIRTSPRLLHLGQER